jgi:hypothetical protein
VNEEGSQLIPLEVNVQSDFILKKKKGVKAHRQHTRQVLVIKIEETRLSGVIIHLKVTN